VLATNTNQGSYEETTSDVNEYTEQQVSDEDATKGGTTVTPMQTVQETTEESTRYEVHTGQASIHQSRYFRHPDYLMPSTDSEIKIFGTGPSFFKDSSTPFASVKYCIFILEYEGPERVEVPAYIYPAAINLQIPLGMTAMKKL